MHALQNISISGQEAERKPLVPDFYMLITSLCVYCGMLITGEHCIYLKYTLYVIYVFVTIVN